MAISEPIKLNPVVVKILPAQCAANGSDGVARTWIGIGVTRLGEFSPSGRVFALGSFLKITELAHIFVLPFS
jgi:hypothetical protein